MDKAHTEGLHSEASVPGGGVGVPNKVGNSQQPANGSSPSIGNPRKIYFK